MSINYYMALRLRAMKAVQEPDNDATIRHVFRWYSKEFHTPLHEVEELPLEDVLVAHYESTYEDMEDEERDQEIVKLTETPDEKQRRLRAKDEMYADSFEMARFTEEEIRKEEAVKKLAQLETKEKPKFASRPAPQSSIPKPMVSIPVKDLKELPPNIELKFISAEDFDRELEADSLPILDRKPQSSK